MKDFGKTLGTAIVAIVAWRLARTLVNKAVSTAESAGVPGTDWLKPSPETDPIARTVD
jgi:hypothetical protein